MKNNIEELVGKCETLTGLCLRFAVGKDEAAVENLSGEIADEIERMGNVPGRDAQLVVSALRSTFKAGAFEGHPKIEVLKRKDMTAERYRWEVASRVMWLLYDFLRAAQI